MILLLAHVLLTTGGYAGLIAGNAYLLFLTRSRDPQVIRIGLTAWRQCSQIFGPSLLAGVFCGFGLAAAIHVSLASPWLVATYALVATAIAIQAGVMVPWQVRCNAMLEAGIVPPLTPVAGVLVASSAFFTAILWLMLARPG